MPVESQAGPEQGIPAQQQFQRQRPGVSFGAFSIFESIAAAAAVLHDRIVRSSRQAGAGHENENTNEESNAICHFASRLSAYQPMNLANGAIIHF